MAVQLWSGDCSLVKGRKLIPGYLSLSSASMEFMSRSKGFLGIGGTNYERIWNVQASSITCVKIGDEGWRSGIVLVEYNGKRVRFHFEPSSVLSAVTSISYALDVSRRLGDGERFSMKRAVQEFNAEAARTA
ncbi:MAG: hypothetical protein QCI82_11260 [Candidatus Thermoplasmatota archaeon]|nr:hypothetical protein [Candidatus Thermoplasmatota archaeon]